MMRDGLQRDAGVGLNEVAYFSKMQTWKIDFTTNNNTTPHIHFFWNAEQEPVVIEIPASTEDVGLVGALLDFRQRSMIVFGAAGFDGLPYWDARYFAELNDILQEEKIEVKSVPGQPNGLTGDLVRPFFICMHHCRIGPVRQ